MKRSNASNWKATFMVEFPDPAERQAMLSQLVGIENQVWMKVGDSPRIMPIADEDPSRADAQKTSAVHFLRFELSQEQVRLLKDGAELAAGGGQYPPFVARRPRLIEHSFRICLSSMAGLLLESAAANTNLLLSLGAQVDE